MTTLENWTWLDGGDEVSGYVGDRWVTVTPIASSNVQGRPPVIHTRRNRYYLGEPHKDHPRRATIKEALLTSLPFVEFRQPVEKVERIVI